ncbi:hypothetical protein FRAHR75_150070 [Frankia sp. Hr75.2]|nr:hypothetical protein FRAHR75_150070 [Frankia sp. Hr75.2]SQD96608.1 hypothetical protein FMEAI12_3670005 [Parafrankia sp. Ea1.12]
MFVAQGAGYQTFDGAGRKSTSGRQITRTHFSTDALHARNVRDGTPVTGFTSQRRRSTCSGSSSA